METGIGNIICKAKCDICNNEWVGVVEVDYIQIDKYKEYKKPKKLQCNNCLQYTTNFEVVEIKRDEVIKIDNTFFKQTKKKQREVIRMFIWWSIKHYLKTLIK